jgi:putative chitinase
MSATETITITEAVLTALEVKDAEGWAPVLGVACAKHGIDTRQRIAAFLANVVVETGRLSTMVESLNYTPERLIVVFGATRISPDLARKLGRSATQKANQEAIANAVYGGAWGLKNLGNSEEGDGWLFRGRGLIQLTGRANYQRFAKAIGVELKDLPALLETRPGAADSAAHFFKVAGCLTCADKDDITAARRAVNPGLLHLAEAKLAYAKVKQIL